jgi:hypothetical protein
MAKIINGPLELRLLLLQLFENTDDETINAAYIKKALAQSLAIFKPKKSFDRSSKICFFL